MKYKNLFELTREDIESCYRCEWFDFNCPICNGKLKAYTAVSLKYPFDYVLLCNNLKCENYNKAAFAIDMDTEIKNEAFIHLRKD